MSELVATFKPVFTKMYMHLNIFQLVFSIFTLCFIPPLEVLFVVFLYAGFLHEPMDLRFKGWFYPVTVL